MGLTAVAALTAAAWATGEGSRGGGGSYTDNTPAPAGHPNPSSFDVSVGECKNGTRTVSFNVSTR